MVFVCYFTCMAVSETVTREVDMSNSSMGKLEKVYLREVWEREDTDFSNWLSKSENLDMLSEEIGISLSLIETEARVGNFSVDILAEDLGTNSKVVIENQLEPTDHDHLGKIITYAAGYDARFLVWIVKDVRDEHKRAIDWLNEHTDSDINIFVIQMEAWRIGDSAVAPRFHVISEPNDWAKAIKSSVSSSELSDLKVLQLDFWNTFKEYSMSQDGDINLRKAYPQHWYDVSFGFSEAHIGLTVNSKKNKIGCEIYIHDSKSLFNSLLENKELIENELNEELSWELLPEKKASRIKLSTDGCLQEAHDWENQHCWLLEKATILKHVFSKYMRS